MVPAGAAPQERTETRGYDGVLGGGALGLHVSKVGPWKAAHPVQVTPGVVALSATTTGTDDIGGDFWTYLVDPKGETVASTPGGSGKPQTFRVDWGRLHASGFGEYVVVVECGLCGAFRYHVDITATYAAHGANVTVDDARLLVVPGKGTETGVTVTNTGQDAFAPALAVEGLPEGWSVELPDVGTLAPGQSFYGELSLKAPADVVPGTRIDFDLVVAGLDRVTLHAAYDEALARLEERSNVVIALVEFGGSGINPYHEEFRGEGATGEDPAWFVEGYPESAEALPLTLDAPTYDDAIAADKDVWANAKGNTLYYVPGTRIVGFICFGACTSLDEGGHGTGTASLAAGTTTGEDPSALIVSVTGDFIYGARWAARQPWIDVISMSLGPYLGTNVVGVDDPHVGTGNPYVPFSIPWAQKLAYGSGKRFFTASSQGWNVYTQGVGGSGPCPYTMGSSFAGSPWTFAVETYWPWTELPWWHSCTPDVVAKGWDLVAASPRSLTGHNSFGNPSGATPQAAGAYARVVHEGRRLLGSSQEGARPTTLAGVALGDGVLATAPPGKPLPERGPLADGVLTVREAEAVYLHGLEQVDVATSYLRHGAHENWTRDATPVPPGGEYASEGWGLLTPTARAGMLAAMRGDAPLPLRPDDDAAYLAYWAAREAFWEPHVADEVWVF